MVTINSVRIQNFRSIIDSGEINLDPNITTLVGPNEAGKTNFLEAIQKFGTGEKFDKDDLSFYCDLDPSTSDQVPIITLNVSGVPLDVLNNRLRQPRKLEELEDQTTNAELTKHFDGSYDVKLSGHSDLVSKAETQREQELSTAMSRIRDRFSNIRDVIGGTNLDVDFPSQGFITHITANTSQTDRITMGLDRISNNISRIEEKADDEIISDISEDLTRIKRSIHEAERYTDSIDELLADIIFNSAFKKGADLIQDEVAIEELKETEDEYFYSDVLQFAEINPNNFHKMDSKDRFDKKHKAASQLETGFNDYWPREDNVQFELSFGGDTVSLHISDSSGSTDLATHRSTGFRHFLSFYIRLIAASGEELEDSILLLDGPGIHLHPEAQKKLKEALENLAEDNQVIYSTHSPFMIDSGHVERIRVINQDVSEGTQIHSNLDDANENESEVDVLAPVRTSIGANFADSLFASSANILVEGYTDKRYLEAFSHLFREKPEQPTINFTTNIIDVDGSKADYLAKILDAEGYDYVILLDSDEAASDRRTGLVDRGVAEEKIHNLAGSIERFSEDDPVTVEDLFTDEFIGRQVAMVKDEIEFDDIRDTLEDGTGGIVHRLESRLSGLEGRGEINNAHLPKGEVADNICNGVMRGEITQSDIGEETVDSFKQLIRDINNTLEEH